MPEQLSPDTLLQKNLKFLLIIKFKIKKDSKALLKIKLGFVQNWVENSTEAQLGSKQRLLKTTMELIESWMKYALFHIKLNERYFFLN